MCGGRIAKPPQLPMCHPPAPCRAWRRSVLAMRASPSGEGKHGRPRRHTHRPFTPMLPDLEGDEPQRTWTWIDRTPAPPTERRLPTPPWLVVFTLGARRCRDPHDRGSEAPTWPVNARIRHEIWRAQAPRRGSQIRPAGPRDSDSAGRRANQAASRPWSASTTRSCACVRFCSSPPRRPPCVQPPASAPAALLNRSAIAIPSPSQGNLLRRRTCPLCRPRACDGAWANPQPQEAGEPKAPRPSADTRLLGKTRLAARRPARWPALGLEPKAAVVVA